MFKKMCGYTKRLRQAKSRSNQVQGPYHRLGSLALTVALLCGSTMANAEGDASTPSVGLPGEFTEVGAGSAVFFCTLERSGTCSGSTLLPADAIQLRYGGKSVITEYRYFTEFDPLAPVPDVPIKVYVKFFHRK